MGWDSHGVVWRYSAFSIHPSLGAGGRAGGHLREVTQLGSAAGHGCPSAVMLSMELSPHRISWVQALSLFNH